MIIEEYMNSNIDNHEVSEPIDDKLISIQKDIFQELQKTRNLLIFQIISVLLFSLCNGGIFFTYNATGNELIPRIIIVSFFFIMVILNVVKSSLLLAKSNKILRKNKLSIEKGDFATGIIHYKTEFYQRSIRRKDKYSEDENRNTMEIVPKVLFWELIIGVLLIAYDYVLLTIYPTNHPIFHLYLFGFAIALYIILIRLTLILRKTILRWHYGFLQVIERGKRLELNYDMPEDDSKFNLKSTTRGSKHEIWAEILEICLITPRSQNWIMQELRLKTETVKEVLEFLLKRDLIEITQIENGKSDASKTTENGKQALHDFYKLVRQYFRIIR